MNKAEIKAETLELVGDNIIGDVIPPESVEDAIIWAQETLALRLGVTYTESSNLLVDSSAVVSLPDSLVKPTRVIYYPGITGTTTIPVSYQVTVTAPEYVYAGELNLIASMVTEIGLGNSDTVTWTCTNADIETQPNRSSTLFNAGRATGLATVTATVSDNAGSMNSGTATMKVVPYTSTISAVTYLLTSGTEQILTPELGWSYEFVGLTVSSPCWVRIYNTQNDLDLDRARAITEDPGIGVSIVWEGIFTSSVLNITDAPDTYGINGDTPRTKVAYVLVKNTGSDCTINMTFNRTETHTNGIF